jgi:hypothetical protein
VNLNQAHDFYRGFPRILVLGLATSLSVSGAAYALSPVNTVNDAQVVVGKNYYNTAQGKTTFVNTGGGGLWLKSGATVRALEVDGAGNATNNGGTVNFYAPNSVVRLDGDINVNSLVNNQGIPLGNGGRVFVDSAYLQQSGNIFANGTSGGLVQFNVAAMTLGANARIEAKGTVGAGGIVSVNSNGIIDLRQGSRIDTSGQVLSSMDRNIINLEGSVINTEGVLRADGIQIGGVGSRGGTIRLVATGRTDLSDFQEALTDARSVATPSFTAAEQTALVARAQSLSANQNGDVHIGPRAFNGSGQPTGGWISANGSSGAVALNNDRTEDDTARAGDGGTIIIAADRRIDHAGLASVNGGVGATGASSTAGGNGGFIALTSNGNIAIRPDTGALSGAFQSNGGNGGQVKLPMGSGVPATLGARGGQGGLIAVSYNGQMQNQGGLIAKGGAGAQGATIGVNPTAQGRAGAGGQGGLIVLSGDVNPIGGGQLNVNGGPGGTGLLSNGAGGKAGVIVSSNPGALPSTQSVFQFNGGVNGALLGAAQPLTQQTAQDEVLTHAENFALLRRNFGPVVRPLSLFGAVQSTNGGSKIRSVNDPLASGNAEAVVLAKTPFSGYPYRNVIVGSSADNLTMRMDPPDSSWLGLDNIGIMTVVNDGNVVFRPGGANWFFNAFGGSHVSLLAKGNVEVGSGFELRGNLAGGTLNVASLRSIFLNDSITTAVRTGIGVVGLHAGSVTLKADQDINNETFIRIFNGTPLIGMTHRYQAGYDFRNWEGIYANANSGGFTSAGSNAGIIAIKAAHHFDNNPDDSKITAISATDSQFFGYGGLIKLESKTFDIPYAESLNVSGGAHDGTIIIRTLP